MTYISRNATRRIAEFNGWTIDVNKSIDVYVKGNAIVVTNWQLNGLQKVWPVLIVDGKTETLILKGNELYNWFATFNPYENFVARMYAE